jgi:hypothetical protein
MFQVASSPTQDFGENHNTEPTSQSGGSAHVDTIDYDKNMRIQDDINDAIKPQNPKDPVLQSGGKEYSDQLKHHKGLQNQDRIDDLIKVQKKNQLNPKDTAYWRRKAANGGANMPISSKRKDWTKIHAIAAVETSDYSYPCPLKVLNSMIEQTIVLDQQRYGEYILAEPALGEKLKNLLCEDAWSVFESRAYDLET